MKIFEFHDSIFNRINYRNYYRGTWEPLRMEMFRLLPFQYSKSGTDLFTIYHVQNAVETDITSYFDGDNCITGWTKAGGGTLTPSGYEIYSYDPGSSDASDYIYSNDMGLTSGDKFHFRISGTISDNFVYSLYNGSDYVTGATGTQTEFTHTLTATGTYTIRIKLSSGTTGTITSGLPKFARTTLDIYSTYVTYNGGNLYNALPRGRAYFRIADGNGLYSDDADIDCVNYWLTNWPTYYTNIVNDPVHFVTSEKDVTRFHAFDYISGDVTYQSPLSNTISVQKGEVVYMAFKQASYEYWDETSTDVPIIYFKYTDTGTDTGTYESDLNPVDTYREGSMIYSKFTASKTGTGQIYITLTSSVDISIEYCDVYKSYSDKCITLSISSAVDFGGTYYKGGFTQKLYKRAYITRSPASKITIEGDERNGVLVKEKITTAQKYTISMKVTESEYNALVEALGATWTAVDQSGKTYTMSNIEISDSEPYQSNLICKISFEDNVTVWSLNNASL